MHSRFFSLGQGRVGQYLSPRVLVVRAPFRRASFGPGGASELCLFGFSDLRSARRFVRFLSLRGIAFDLQTRQYSPWPVEVQVCGHLDLARRLAQRERQQPSSRKPPDLDPSPGQPRAA